MCSRVAIIKEGWLIKLQKISELRDDNYKKYHVTAKQPLDAGYFAADGVTNYTTHENGASFLFKGDVNHIVSRLGGLQLTDLTIEEPSLEEIFLHYYQ